jgi:hypothetical protein
MNPAQAKQRFIIKDCFSERIRLTRYAVDQFGPRFRAAGIDPESIRTLDQWEDALASTFTGTARKLVDAAGGADPRLNEILALLMPNEDCDQ